MKYEEWDLELLKVGQHYGKGVTITREFMMQVYKSLTQQLAQGKQIKMGPNLELVSVYLEIDSLKAQVRVPLQSFPDSFDLSVDLMGAAKFNG